MSMERVTTPVVRKLEAMPLTWRLIVILLTLLLAALLTTSAVTAYLLQRDLNQNVDDQLRAVALPIAEDNINYSRRDSAFYHRDRDTGPTNFFFLHQPADGSPWDYDSPTGVDVRPKVPSLSHGDARVQTNRPFTVESIDGSMRWRVIAGSYTDGSTFAVGMPLSGVNHTMQRFAVVSTVMSLGAVAASGILGWFATRRAFRPLRRIEDTAAAIAAGDLTRRVPVRASHDEVASLSDSLNSMLGQVEHSFTVQEASELKMRQFVADASHELRTPLATVRGYAELYRQGAVQDSEHVDQAMDRIEGEASRMGLLVDDLLLLARLDDERPLRQTADDAVARGEEGRQRLDARRILRDDRAALRNLREQTAILSRIRHIDAAAEHGDRAACLERTAMRPRIDAARCTADDRQARSGQLLAELERQRLTVRAQAPRADDRDAALLWHERPSAVEHGRRRKDFLQ